MSDETIALVKEVDEHKVCAYHKQMSTKIDEIHTALIGTFEKKGIVAQVRDLVDNAAKHAETCPYKDDIKKHCGLISGLCNAMWVIYSAVIASIVGLILSFTRHN
jgi:hypothetical protein